MGYFNPKGSPVVPRTVAFVEGAKTTGRVPAIVVYVRTTSKGLRGFTRFCKFNGLRWVRIPGERSDVYEVVGPVRGLWALTRHESVLSWHRVVNAASYIKAGGSGTAKPRSMSRADPKPVSKEAAREMREMREMAEEFSKRRDALAPDCTDDAILVRKE